VRPTYETGRNQVDDLAEESHDARLSSLTATLQRLVAEGFGPVLGLDPDRRRRSAVSRVARLGPDELSRQLDLLYGTQCPFLVAYAARILGRRDGAEDVVNEAFARVLRADPDLQAPEGLPGYVSRVVRNQALDWGSRTTRDRERRQPLDVTDLEARLDPVGRSAEDQVCDQISLALAIRTLSVRQRQCFVLRFVEGLDVQGTADRLRISEGNVKRLCYEARERLAAVLEVA
jgi:RNA polymerase sigma-70 factor (ECF subfamily)